MESMPTRASKQRLPDPNLMALSIVEGVTGETLVPKPAPEPDTRNPAAVSRGSKGGTARADNLGKKKRSEIAKKAARARWKG